MMNRTDRHFRVFMRQWTQRALLYTEMIPTRRLLGGERDALLDHAPEERPLMLQLGGDDPGELAECARLAEAWGYDGVNLNVGCPSARVRRGNYGGSLMARPDLVARCVEAMRGACGLPVTVKHRIGFDELDRYEDMERFVRIVAGAGCGWFTVHARKAWLGGLSPEENRTVPPLRYEEVARLKRALPWLGIEINGGVTTLEAARAHLERVDAVMIGRAAWDNPALFAEVDRRFFGVAGRAKTRHEAVEGWLPYAARQVEAGAPLRVVVRPLLTLFNHRPGAQGWRRRLSQCAPGDGIEVVRAALAAAPR